MSAGARLALELNDLDVELLQPMTGTDLSLDALDLGHGGTEMAASVGLPCSCCSCCLACCCCCCS
jgi:hypothetical protein